MRDNKKKCSKCKIEKEPSEFRKYSASSDGLKSSCKECSNKADAEYYKNNTEKKLESVRERKERDIVKHREIMLKAFLKRRDKHPLYAINDKMSCSLRRAIKSRDTNKIYPWESYVDYKLDELIKHIESKWEPWMNWDNYGKYIRGGEKKWHIDHICPQTRYDIKELGDKPFRQCWALNNLQPLEALSNIKKRDR